MDSCACGAQATETITLCGMDLPTCTPCREAYDVHIAAHRKKRREESYRSATRAIAAHVAMQRSI